MRGSREFLRFGLLSAAVALLAVPASALAEDTVENPQSGLPFGIPNAARHREPKLAKPRAWPFKGERFPRTSGTSRLRGGALLWTDFLYDDHGAVGEGKSASPTSLAASNGTYSYPEARDHMNGADIFRVGIGLTKKNSWWRVDWNTLASRNVPAAAFALDTDNSSRTGGSTWPGVPGVRSPGVDRLLLVTGSGAWLVDRSGKRRSVGSLGGDLSVEPKTRSFVVHIPRKVLRPRGEWRVRLAAGLANSAGNGFRPVPSANGAAAGQPPVYNLGFRRNAQEPAPSNYWKEDRQAAALATGDIARFATIVHWHALAKKQNTPEPVVRGYSNRWYVSSIAPGQGVIPESSPLGDLRPNFLGRVQPYAVYVPRSYDAQRRNRLVWLLHSLSVMHNQYGSLDPNFVRATCERLRTICATTLGRGPDGWYVDEAELDFFEVWGDIARHFELDPQRTVVAGYSMGGFAAYRFGLGYPDLFSQAIALAGPPSTGLRVASGVGAPASKRFFDTAPLVENGRWSRFMMASGAVDELVPVTSVLQQISAFERFRYRYQFELYPTKDHLVWATEDSFPTATAFIDRRPREAYPGHVTFNWFPAFSSRRWSIGPTGAWWVRGIRARSAKTDELAHIDAVSRALPNPPVASSLTRNLITHPGGSGQKFGLSPILGDPGEKLGAAIPESVLKLDPSAGVRTTRKWTLGRSAARRNLVSLSLRNVRLVGVATRSAGRQKRSPMTITLNTDGPITLSLLQLTRGQVVSRDGRRLSKVGKKRHYSLSLSRGRHTVSISKAPKAKKKKKRR